ncbi:MarR family transcriptional regulator [Fibrella sp. HMF5335]|uniref:MarR family transcriptional regulator n=1 Tax=Fibrella rubiginis TaxID=2817060 RepID=A0A939GEY0_9BACT|nr:MarR family transcriptional regulator [Fibrella rubiginis]MBO0935466.1 MarR family transcriptional regulator [Fibrella rubiginis]
MDTHKALVEHIQQNNIVGHLHRLSRLLGGLSEHRWAKDGYPDVRNGHVQLLRNLDPEGTRNTVLAQRAHITKQTMGRLVKELANSGYVTISVDPTDSRAQRVLLTARGTAFLTYLAATLADLNWAFANVLGEGRLTNFSQTLQDLLAFAETRQQQQDL